jgi:hypothetical protein
MGTVAERPDVDWLTSYVLGVAFSIPSDAAACAQILAVTSDRRALAEARARLGAGNTTDASTRQRAGQLLSRAVRMVDATTEGGGPQAAAQHA